MSKHFYSVGSFGVHPSRHTHWQAVHHHLIAENRDDALILIDGNETGDAFTARMLVLGQDGTLGEFCGNGSRACAAFLFAHYSHAQSLFLLSSKGKHPLIQQGEAIYSIQLPPVSFVPNAKFTPGCQTARRAAWRSAAPPAPRSHPARQPPAPGRTAAARRSRRESRERRTRSPRPKSARARPRCRTPRSCPGRRTTGHRVRVRQRVPGDDRQPGPALHQRGGLGNVVAAGAAQRGGQHVLPAQREDITPYRVVERQCGGEQRGQEQPLRRLRSTPPPPSPNSRPGPCALAAATTCPSLTVSRTSAVAKYLVEFWAGLPSGLSSRAEISAGMSCGWQFSTQPACSAVRRAGS